MLLLHLSDFHFRSGEVGTAMDPNRHLRNELLLDAEQMCRRLGSPQAVLVSGDLAFGGQQDEFAFALKWLEQLCATCGVSVSDVIVIPGNHDVVRTTVSRPVIQAIHHDIKATGSVSLDGLLRGLLTDRESGRLLYESLSPFNLFAEQFFCDLLPPERTIAKREFFLNDGSVLRVCGLNSSFVSSNADKMGELFVDPAAFQIARERGVENLVMCHHPFAWLRQGDVLRDHLNTVAVIQLFGHEHTNRIELGRDWVRVAASASHPDREEPGWEPGYNLIELAVEGAETSRTLDVKVHVRVWQHRPGQFRPKMDGEADVFHQSISLDAWAPPRAPVVAKPAVESAPTAGVVAEPVRSNVMDTLRDISVRFFKLSLSQKSAIAGRLGLLEEEDVNQPDFERFRRVFLRARDRGLVEELDREVKAVTPQ